MFKNRRTEFQLKITKRIGFGFLLLTSIGLLLQSCSKSKSKDYKLYEIGAYEWESKSIHKFVGQVNYTATEVPINYFILKNANKLDSKSMDSIYTTHITERIIEFDFQHVASKDLLKKEFTNLEYEEAVKYMSFSLSNDFKIVTKANDTISCVGVHFERTFKVTPYKRALLYFNGIAATENIKLLYQDRLYGNGLLEFDFKEKPIAL